MKILILKSLLRLKLKLAVSFFILFQLAVMLILPNNFSYISRSTEKWLVPYANLMGMNASWNFFSPDPAHTMFLKYTVWFDDLDILEPKEPVDGYIPPEKEKIVLNSSERRLLYAMRFLILDPDRMRIFLAPWLCQQYPNAKYIEVSHIQEPIPNLERARLGEERDIQGRKLMEDSFACGELGDGLKSGVVE